MKRIAHIFDGYIVNVSLGKDDAELQPGQMLEADAIAQGFGLAPQKNPPKSWPDVEAFIAEFTMDEMAAIGLSSDPTIAGLRLLLSAWRSAVHSEDPRVILGLNALVDTGIISRHRQLEILNAPM